MDGNTENFWFKDDTSLADAAHQHVQESKARIEEIRNELREHAEQVTESVLRNREARGG